MRCAELHDQAAGPISVPAGALTPRRCGYGKTACADLLPDVDAAAGNADRAAGPSVVRGSACGTP